MRRWHLIALVAVLLASLAGCNGGDPVADNESMAGAAKMGLTNGPGGSKSGKNLRLDPNATPPAPGTSN